MIALTSLNKVNITKTMKLTVVRTLVNHCLVLTLVHHTTCLKSEGNILQEIAGTAQSLLENVTKGTPGYRIDNNVLTKEVIRFLIHFNTCLGNHYFKQSNSTFDIFLRLCSQEKYGIIDDTLLKFRLMPESMIVRESMNSFCKSRFFRLSKKLHWLQRKVDTFSPTTKTSPVTVRKLLVVSEFGNADSKKVRFPRSLTNTSAGVAALNVPLTSPVKVLTTTTSKTLTTYSSNTQIKTTTQSTPVNSTTTLANNSVNYNTNYTSTNVTIPTQTVSTNETSPNQAFVTSTVQSVIVNSSESYNITTTIQRSSTTPYVSQKGNFDSSIFSGLLFVAVIANVSSRPEVYTSFISLLCVLLVGGVIFLLGINRNKIKRCISDRMAYSTRSDQTSFKLDTESGSQNVSASSNDLMDSSGTTKSVRFSDVKSLNNETSGNEYISSWGNRTSSDVTRPVTISSDNELMSSTGSDVSRQTHRPLLEQSLSIESLLSTIASLSNENQTVSLTISCNSIKRQNTKARQEKDVAITLDVSQDSGGSQNDFSSIYDNNTGHEDERGYSKLITPPFEPIPQPNEYDYIDHIELEDVPKTSPRRVSNYINVTLPASNPTSPDTNSSSRVPWPSSVNTSPYINEDNVLLRGTTLRSSLV